LPYCLPSDVKTLITTDKEDEEINDIIIDATTDLNDRLNGATMDTTIKRLCIMRLTAVTIAQKQCTEIKLQDGETTQLGGRIREWNQYVQDKIDKLKDTGRSQKGKVFTSRTRSCRVDPSYLYSCMVGY
jgi:hypothetical protein